MNSCAISDCGTRVREGNYLCRRHRQLEERHPLSEIMMAIMLEPYVKEYADSVGLEMPRLSHMGEVRNPPHSPRRAVSHLANRSPEPPHAALHDVNADEGGFFEDA